jgi:aminopeptidase N
VLEENLDKAKEQFKQVPKMLEAFEHWFGPYPFYEDSFKLVEVPYLGMEHQSSVTYGNKYRNGYLGSDLSGTGWGLQFDFIIIHESGHEWFANNITVKDIADLWVHEGFTAYSESLYLDYHYNRDAARDYIVGTRNSIRNDRPLIGNYDVNHEGSGDMYYKGANLLHMIRTLIDDDKKWREILRGLNKKFYHQTVTTQQVESYINDQTEIDLQPIFDQYLRTTQIPELEIRFRESENSYSYVWNNVISGFEMPVDVIINGDKKRIFPTTRTQTLEFEPSRIESSPDFYIKLKKQ